VRAPNGGRVYATGGDSGGEASHNVIPVAFSAATMSRKNASVLPSGDSSARLTFSITISGSPPDAEIDQSPSRSRAREMKYTRVPSGDQNGSRQSNRDRVTWARRDEARARVKICRIPSTSATNASVFPSGDQAGDA